MRPLLTVWRAAGHGWLLDAFWLASVGFADDVGLVSHIKESLEEMVSQNIDGFAAAGLEVGTAQGKSHWTCFPPSPGCTLSVGGVDLPWESKLTYVGTQITPLNQSEKAMVYRMAQATKTYGRWREVLTNKHLPAPFRLAIAGRIVWVSLLWLSSIWLATKSLDRRLNSWADRMSARIQGVWRRPGEGPGTH